MYQEQRESVILNNQGKKIFGVLHMPIGVEKPPVVLICHGLGGDKTGKYRIYVRISELLANYGVASLRFDFRGAGDSEGDFSEVTLESEVSDALKALDFLENLSSIDPNRIAIMGRSFGGTIALIAANRYKKVKTVVTWAPLFDGEQWLATWKKIHSEDYEQKDRDSIMRINGQVPGKEFFKQLFDFKIEDELNGINHIPLLHIHGEKDGVVFMEHHASRFKKFRSDHHAKTRFIQLQNSDHDFSLF